MALTPNPQRKKSKTRRRKPSPFAMAPQQRRAVDFSRQQNRCGKQMEGLKKGNLFPKCSMSCMVYFYLPTKLGSLRVGKCG